MINASREEERREARHTAAKTDALREIALDTLQQWTHSKAIQCHGESNTHSTHSAPSLP